MLNRSAVSDDNGNHRCVETRAEKVNVGVGSVSAQNSLSCRIDVFRIRVSQSERMGKVRILRLAGVVNVSAII